jgi:hypothetical protein
LQIMGLVPQPIPEQDGEVGDRFVALAARSP